MTRTIRTLSIQRVTVRTNVQAGAKPCLTTNYTCDLC